LRGEKLRKKGKMKGKMVNGQEERFDILSGGEGALPFFEC